MRIFDLPTPALLVDRRTLQENMRQMANLLRNTGVGLRPHYKSHKCTSLAHAQLSAGAIGMTCAKLSEAEDLVFSGVDDVLIANQVTDPDKVLRLARLARFCRLTVCVDGAANARDLSRAAAFLGSTIHCLVEYDIGMNRCGVRTQEAYIALAEEISSLQNLRYDGIQAYAGHASHLPQETDRVALTRENERRVAELAAVLQNRGIPVHTISGGSTGTASIKASGGVYTELQAGSYLFMDSTYRRLNLPFACSLYVLATVVSVSKSLAILDVGVKGLGADQDDPMVLTTDGVPVTGRIELNEEHLKLFGGQWRLNIGDHALVIPGHCCSTVNLYDRLYICEGDAVVDRLEITARGLSQ